jgi:hypothetical protein
MEIFGQIIIFWNIDLHYSLWLLMMVQGYDTWHNKKYPHGIFKYILEKKI